MCRVSHHLRVLLGVMAAIGPIAAVSPAATLLVPSQYPTIQAAVNVAAPGDEIRVSRGSYPEDVIIQNKGVTITGVEGPSLTTVTSFSWDDGSPFLDMTIHGFTVSGEINAVAEDAVFTLSWCRVEGTVTATSNVSQGNLGYTFTGCELSGDVSIWGISYDHQQRITGCDFLAGASLVVTGLDVLVSACTFIGGDLEAWGVNELSVSGNELDGGGVEAHTGTHGSVTGNTVRNGTGIASENEISVVNNVVMNCSVGIEMLQSSLGYFRSCQGNLVAGCAQGIRILGDVDEVTGNTVVESTGTGVYIDTWDYALSRNLVASNGVGVEIAGGAPTTLDCNDVWDNTGGNWVGIPDPAGSNGNFSLDPVFCWSDGGWYGLASASPCLPGNHPTGAACGQIGARGQECEAPVTVIMVPLDYPTIQAAVDAAASGDRILVAAGSYPEAVVVDEKGLTITATEGPDLTTVSSFSWSDGSPSYDMTIAGFAVDEAISAAAIDATFTLDGCRVGGPVTATATAGFESYARFELSGCEFDANTSVSGISQGFHRVEGCAFRGEASLDLLGLYVLVSACTFSGGNLDAHGVNTITVSDNELDGGGIEASTGTNGAVTGNTVRNGTGIAIDDDISAVANVVLDCSVGIEMGYSSWGERSCRDNLVAGCAQGVRILDRVDEVTGNTVVECIGNGVYVDTWDYALSRNLVASNGVGVEIAGDAPTTLDCNDVWDNTGGDWEGVPDPTGVDGNLCLDPVFCAPDIRWYGLAATSPCLPGNHPTGTACGQIGARGQECDEPVGVEQPMESPTRAFALMPAKPNPFNLVTRISFAVPRTEWVRLNLFNALGQRVTNLLNRKLEPGAYVVTIDGTGLGSGVYFCRMKAGEFSAIEKMIVVR